MKTILYRKDQIIFKEGDPANVLYDVVSGRVGIYAGYDTPEEKRLAVCGSDQVFGEMGVIDLLPRSATAVALTDDTVLAEITEDELFSYFEDKPEKLFKILQLLSTRLRQTTERYIDVCRTIYENEEAEASGEEKCPSLLEHLGIYYDYYHMKMMV